MKTPKQIFHEKRKESRKAEARFPKMNNKIKTHLIYPVLDELNITSWEILNAHAMEIDDKISKLSSRQRDVVMHIHTYCLIESAGQISKEITHE